ncbi:MAG: hypothetical protein RL375_3665 [Pseudomonadota bacterium]
MSDSAHSRFMAPGAALMRRFSVRAKLQLFSALMLAGLLALCVVAWVLPSQWLVQARAEAAGGRAVTAALAVVRETMAHRGQTALVLSGTAAAKPALELTRRQLGSAVAALDAALRADEAPAAARSAGSAVARWSELRDQVTALAQGRHEQDVVAAFARHNEVIDRLARFIVVVADDSGLRLDSDPALAALVELTVERSVPWMDLLGRLRGGGAAVLARRAAADASASSPSAAPASLSAGQRQIANLLMQADAADQVLAQVGDRIGALERHGEATPTGWPAAEAATRAYAQQTRQTFGAGEPASDASATSRDATAWFEAGSAAIARLTTLQDGALARLQHLLDRRTTRLQQGLVLALASLLTLALGVSYLLLALAGQIGAAVSAIHASVNACAEGHLDRVTQVVGRDEFARIGQDLDRMSDNLSVSVAEIRSQAALVGGAGRHVSASSQELARQAQAQAASLCESSAAVRQLNDSVRANADSAAQADRLSEGVSARAQAVAGVMQDALATMGRIESSSRRMGEIVAAIDAIAFQTNILALNAAVEAARAGDSGRGFAVVASEVRSLAQKSAQSAGEIRLLIQTSSEEVSGGVRTIRGIGSTVDGVVDGIREVASRVKHIAEGSEAQSTALQQVAAGIAELEQLTQGHAAIVDEAAHEAGELQDRASRLTAAVANIHLRQGTADEAYALVDRARALFERQGEQALLAQCNREGSEFADRDLYVFVLDRHGQYIAYSGQPAKVGKRLVDMLGRAGQQLVDDIWAQADRGSGWVDYTVPHPITGKPQAKASCVVALTPQRVLGCGIYKLQARTASATVAAASVG